MFRKKCMAILLALTMSSTMFPTYVFAGEEGISPMEAEAETEIVLPQSVGEETAKAAEQAAVEEEYDSKAEYDSKEDEDLTAEDEIKADVEEIVSNDDNNILAAEASEETVYGTVGTNISWSYNPMTKTLDISGGENADWGNTSFSYNAPWKKYQDEIETVTVLGNITEIPSWFCDFYKELKTVQLTKNITVLGSYCFADTAIEDIDFISNIEEIGQGSFSGCDSLTKITIPSRVKRIDSNAFKGCVNLTEVEFESADEYIDYLIYSNAFSGCEKLRTFIPNDRNGLSLGEKGELLIEDDDHNKCLLCVPCDVTEYRIPDDIKNVSGSAFSNCGELKTITIPKTYTGDVFSSNDVLEKIIVEEGNPDYSADECGVLFSTSSAFPGAKKLELYPAGRRESSYIVPDEVVSLANIAFDFGSVCYLRDLYLPRHVTSYDSQFIAVGARDVVVTLHGYENSDMYEYYLKQGSSYLAWETWKTWKTEDALIEVHDNYKGERYYYPAKSIYGKMYNPAKSGYIFDGWYVSNKVKLTESLDVTKYLTYTITSWVEIDGKYQKIDGAIYLYPHWKAKVTKKISKAKITVANGTFSNYAEVKPKVTVKYSGKTLKSGTDYKLTWSNNTKVSSKAKVKITGIGNYTGSVTKTFKVEKRSIASSPIHLYMKTTSCTYDGKAQKPKFTLYYDNTVLQPETDYKYSYKNNVKAGTGVITIKGIGSYNGSREKKFKISKESQPIKYTSSITKTYKEIGKKYSLNVKGVREFSKVTYTSSDKKVAAVSSSGKVTLKGVGSAKVKIVCAATKNYKKTTKTVPVIVKAKPQIKVSLIPKTFAYNDKGKVQVNTNSTGKVTFSSADSSIVKIDKTSGEMTAKKPGKTNVTVYVAAGEMHVAGSKKVTVTVQKGQQIIEASDIQKTIFDGDFNIGANLVQGNGKLTYKSSNPDILSVDEAGNAKINPDNVKEETVVNVMIQASGNIYYSAAEKSIKVTIKKYDINDDSMFVKQQTDSTCTLAATVMMMRRKAVMLGKDWSAIAEAGYGNINDFERAVWIDGSGLKGSFEFIGISVTSVAIESQGKDYFIGMLSEHPEGIVVYNSHIPHAILLTDYDAVNGIFYCADSDTNPSIPRGRIQLNQSYFYRANPGESNEQHIQRVLGGVDKVWFVR